MLAVDALEETSLNSILDTVEDGEELMEFLRRNGRHAHRAGEPLPGLILLDLNMPRMDGHEFLATIKEDESLKTIPVVVLTTSDADEDILKSYKLQAACFVTKPVDFAQFQKIVNSLSNFWFTVVRLPGSA